MLTIEERLVRRWARWRCFGLIPEPCAVCGNPKTQAHHDDYNKPDEIRWLCQNHHAEWHRNNVTPSITEETLDNAVIQLPSPGRPSNNKPRSYKGSLQEAFDNGELKLTIHPTGR